MRMRLQLHWIAVALHEMLCPVAVILELDQAFAAIAAMAQRKGELLKLETLERLASLYSDLQGEAAAAN